MKRKNISVIQARPGLDWYLSAGPDKESWLFSWVSFGQQHLVAVTCITSDLEFN